MKKSAAILIYTLAVIGIFVGSVLFVAGITNSNILAGVFGGLFIGVSVGTIRAYLSISRKS